MEANSFDIFVKKYAEKHNITLQEAMRHKTVIDVRNYYILKEEEEQKKHGTENC